MRHEKAAQHPWEITARDTVLEEPKAHHQVVMTVRCRECATDVLTTMVEPRLNDEIVLVAMMQHATHQDVHYDGGYTGVRGQQRNTLCGITYWGDDAIRVTGIEDDTTCPACMVNYNRQVAQR